MKKLIVMLLVVLTVLPLAGCHRPREDHLIDLPGGKTDDPSPDRGPDVPTDELAVLEFCFGFEESLNPLVNIIKTEDNGYWLNPNKHQELKEIAKESIKYCEKLIEKPGQYFPENIDAIKEGYLGVAEDLKEALTQVAATIGERNNDRLIELKDEVKAAFQDHLDIYTGYAAKYRQDMAEVVLMHDIWHFSITELILAAYDRQRGYYPISWAQEKQWPQVKEAALATLEECEKFLAKYKDKPDFPQKYAEAKDEQVARVQELQSLMDELIGFIEEKNQKGIYYTVQPQVQKLLEEGGAARDEWTERLQSKVYLFPVVHYPEVALDYLLTLVGLEERQQLEYYLRKVQKGETPRFGLDKLMEYTEAMQEMFFTHYMSHRFLKVHEDLEHTDPFMKGSKCEVGPFPVYSFVMSHSRGIQKDLQELILAIKRNDTKGIVLELEGIDYSYKNINSTISPYGRYRRPLG